MTQTLTTGWPEELALYRNHLEDNQPHTLNYRGTNYTFQFHGPKLGKTGNWLQVTREDGEVRKFGSGHCSEWVWRAFSHIDEGWDKPQVPRYKEDTSVEEPWFQF